MSQLYYIGNKWGRHRLLNYVLLFYFLTDKIHGSTGFFKHFLVQFKGSFLCLFLLFSKSELIFVILNMIEEVTSL